MNPLLDPILDVSDGGSGPRRRTLADSMIAGRRRPSTSSADDDAEASSATKGKSAPGSGRRRSRAASAKSEEEEPERPATPRRRRSTTSRSRSRAAAEAPEEAADGATEEAEPAVAEAEPATAEEEQPEPVAATAPAEPPEAVASDSIAPQDLQALAGEVSRLRGVVEEQRGTLAEVRAALLELGQQVDRTGYRPRLGVFVDVPNLIYGFEGDREVHMGKLLDLLRDGRQLVRATAYSPVSDDPREPLEQQKFVSPFVRYDYRIVTKPLKRFADGSIKGNFDVEMAIDMLSMADRVDVVAIVSGDADFARAVEAVQARGVRVEVVAFAGSTSLEMRALADHYLELTTVIDDIT